jgi:hypothetical protein
MSQYSLISSTKVSTWKINAAGFVALAIPHIAAKLFCRENKRKENPQRERGRDTQNLRDRETL